MNMPLGLMGGVVNAPRLLDIDEINACKTYREVVRLSWDSRRSKGMTKKTLAELADLYAPHVTDYLHIDDNPKRRDLPAHKLGAWACVTGNFAIQQWLEIDAERKLIESLQNRRAA